MTTPPSARVPDPDARFLAIDAGNTNVHAALFDGAALEVEDSRPALLAGELEPDLRTGRAPTFAAAASVNAEAKAALLAWAASAGLRLLFVPDDLPFPIPVRLARPDLVGPDRVLAAAAALEIARGPVIVVNAGTAVTVDHATPEQGFLGGAILPGLRLMSGALRSGTSRLPMVEPGPAEDPLGVSTEEAIRAGVFLGWVGAVREVVGRMTARFPGAAVIASGGDAGYLEGRVQEIRLVRPGLVLQGIRLAVDRYRAMRGQAPA